MTPAEVHIVLGGLAAAVVILGCLWFDPLLLLPLGIAAIVALPWQGQ